MGFPLFETLGEGLSCQSDGNLALLFVLFPKIKNSSDDGLCVYIEFINISWYN